MFLAPAIVAALGYELAYAIKNTEKQTSSQKVVDLGGLDEAPIFKTTGVDKTPYFVPRKSMPIKITDITDPANIVELDRLGSKQTDSTAIVPRRPETSSFKDAAINATCNVVAGLVPNIPFVDVQRLCVLGLNAGITNRAKLAKYVRSSFIKLRDMTKKKGNSSRATMSSVPTKRGAVKAKRATSTTGGYIAGVSAPAAKGTVVGRVGNPQQRNIKRGVLVKHTEMLNVLTSDTTANNFKVSGYTINPAKADVFPWLSSIATSYDKYRIRKMVIYLNSMRPTSEAGKFGVAFDPDSTDDLPVDRSELYAMYKHVEGPIWQSLAFNVPVSGKELFCNSHTSGDSKLIDDGQLVFFSDLVAATSSPLADIIVDYEIELLDPQQALYNTSTNDYLGLVFTARVVPSNLAVTGPKLSTMIMDSATTMRLVPSPGYYKLEVFIQETGAASPVITFTNVTASDMFGVKLGSTTLFLGTVYFRVTSSSLVQASLGIVGDHLLLGLSGAANWLALEKYQVTLSRISPAIYSKLIQTGYTKATPGNTV